MKDTAKETSDAEHYAAIGHNPTESGFKQALRASSVVLASFVVLGLGLALLLVLTIYRGGLRPQYPSSFTPVPSSS